MLTVGKLTEMLKKFDADSEVPLLELVRFASVHPGRAAARAIRKTLPPPEQDLNRHNAIQELTLGDLFPLWLDARHACDVASATLQTASEATTAAANDESPFRERLARLLLADIPSGYPRRGRTAYARFEGVTVRVGDSDGQYAIEVLPVAEVPLDAGKTLPPDPLPSNDPVPL